MTRPCGAVVRLAVLFVSFTWAASALAADTARIDAKVRSKVTKYPVGDAELQADLAPADGTPEHTTYSEPFGNALLEGLAAGTHHVTITHAGYEKGEFDVTVTDGQTRQETFDLVPKLAPDGFELSLQALDVRSGIGLPDAEFVVERWPGQDSSGPPAFKRTYLGGRDGNARAIDMRPGYYRITTSRYAWETLTLPDTGAIRIQKDHAAVAHLKPISKTLRVIVGGYHPVYDRTFSASNAGASVEFEGLAFDDTPAISAQVVTTDKDGNAYLPNLAALNWRVTIRKPGYKTTTATWRCSKQEWNGLGCDTMRIEVGPNGSTSWRGWMLPITPEWKPSTLRVNLASPYLQKKFLSVVRGSLTGLHATPTEGIERGGLNNSTSTDAHIEFSNLLPGRYRLNLKADGYVNRFYDFQLPPAPDERNVPSGFALRSKPLEGLVEVDSDVTQVMDAWIEPEPTKIRGRVLSVERLGKVRTARQGTDERIFEPHAAQGLTFVMHPGLDIVAPELRTVTVDTDAQGNFTAELIPGVWGLEIPSKTTHGALDLQVRTVEAPDITAPGNVQQMNWPLVRGWTQTFRRTSFGYSHGLSVDGGEVWDVDVRILRRFTHMTGPVNADARYRHATFRLSGGLGANVTPFDLGTAVFELRGPVTRRARIGPNDFEFSDLTPGTYTLSLDAPAFALEGRDAAYEVVNTLTVTVPDGPWPGKAPTEDELGEERWIAARADLLNLNAQYLYFQNKLEDFAPQIKYTNWEWDPLQGAYAYKEHTPSSQGAAYFSTPDVPGFILKSEGGLVPAPPCTLWFEYQGDLWVKRECNASHIYPVTSGGPNSEPKAADKPPVGDSYPLLARTYMTDGTERNGFPILLSSGVPASRVVSGTKSTTTYQVTGSTVSEDPKWALTNQGCNAVLSSPFHLDCTFIASRRMLVSGAVHFQGGAPAKDVRVAVLDRMGRELSAGPSLADGKFSFGSSGSVSAQPVWVEVRQPGYLPVRKRFEVTPPAAPDVTNADVELVPLPSPTVSGVTLDRAGGILQGVARAADELGRFNEQSARAALTATWTAKATPATISYTLDALDPDMTGVPRQETITSEDPIRAIGLIDRRSFPTPGAAATDAQPIDVASLSDPTEVAKILKAAVAGTKDGKRYYLFNSPGGKGAAAGTFSGTFQLPGLPAGDFKPYVVAVSASGAVAHAEYTPANGQLPITVFQLPEWIATLLNVIGVAASAIPQSEYKEAFPKGMFTPQAEFAGGIALGDGNTLDYGYSLGVILIEGTHGPSKGLLSLASKLIGVALKATLGVEFHGKDNGLGVSIAGSASRDFADEGGLGVPAAFVKGGYEWKKPDDIPISFEKVEFTATTTGKLASTLTPGPSPYTVTLSTEGSGEFDVGVDLTPVLSFAPYAGPAFQALKKLGLWFQGRVVNGTGAKIQREIVFEPPASGGTQTGEAPRTHLFGRVGEVKGDTTTVSYTLKVGAGLAARAGSSLAEAYGGVQLGAKNGDGFGLKVTPNALGTWPPIKSVEGAASIVIRGKLKLGALQLTRGFQYDGIVINWQPNTEPYFDLVPANSYSITLGPADAPAAEWKNADGVLVSGFFGGGDAHLASGSASGLAYTQTRADGTMEVLVSPRDGGFGTPVTAATGNAISAVAESDRPGGGRVLVYADLPPDSLGDPFAASTIRVVTQDASGGAWSAPTTVAARPGQVDRLWAVAAGDAIVVVFSESDAGTGALDPHRTLLATVFKGGSWSTPVELLADDVFRGGALAAKTGTESDAVFAAVSAAGDLVAHAWNGTEWSADPALASGQGSVSVAFDDSGAAWVAAAGAGGGLTLHRRADARAAWSVAGKPPVDASAVEVAFLPMRDGNASAHALAWIDADGATLRWAWVGDDGTIVAGPAQYVAIGSTSRLELLSLDEARPAVRAIFRHDDGTRTAIEERRLAIADTPTDPGDGGMPGDGGTSGSVDAGSTAVDGGAGPDGPATDVAGCGCSGTPLSFLAFVVGALVARRRRAAPP